MNYKILLILFLTFGAVPAAPAADAARYRIELLVLRHLDASTAPQQEAALRDFSAALDLVPRQPEGDGAQPEAAPSHAEPGPSAAQPLPGDAADSPGEPPAVAWIESPGDVMQQAWRRLRQSADFRPELYFSWEQVDAAPFPRIRVHDEQVVYEHDPGGAAAAHQAMPSQLAASNETGDSAAPEPLRYFRIDGTARLTRTRFLNLDLDLEWREPVARAELPPQEVPPQVADPGITLPPQAVNVHRIRQKRQVRTDQIEYFDGSFIGVLALVTRIDPEGEAPAAPVTLP